MTTEREEEAAAPGQPRPPAADPSDPERLKALLDEERERAQSYHRNWQRAAADYQNFKRRVEEERTETARLANAALIINLLPMIDDLERALMNVDAHLAGLTWLDGIRLIHRKFQAVLEMAGVEEIPADGEPFDPALHEAIGQAPGEEGKVISVVQKGYRLGDRVVRPAMVIVGHGEGQPGEREA
ncbi:MAG: nucleotide exchange factor GrpE [Dehalococcoidia bacterium]